MKRLILLVLCLGLLGLQTTGGTAGGDALPEYDRVFQDLMEQWGIPGGALAVIRDGQFVHNRGYGFADLENRVPVQVDARFRIGSVSKPITAAAILNLVEDGRLSLDEPAFAVLTHLPAPVGQDEDPRLGRITVRHLLEHSAGWIETMDFAPMFMTTEIAAKMGSAAPADCATIIRYMRGQPLDFDPGTRFAYSNFGYCVLENVIETISGQTYETYVRETVLQPAGVTSMALGRSMLADRLAGEVRYYDYPGAEPVAPVFPEIEGQVPYPYGGFYLEGLAAAGGWVSTAADLAQLAWALDPENPSAILQEGTLDEIYARPAPPLWENGSAFYSLGWQVRTGLLPAVWRTGSLPGTVAVVYRHGNGVIWAALFNMRPDTPGDEFLVDVISTLSGPANIDRLLGPGIAAASFLAVVSAGILFRRRINFARLLRRKEEVQLRGWILSIPVIGLATGALVSNQYAAAYHPQPVVQAENKPREVLTYPELLAEDLVPEKPVENRWFMPASAEAPASHTLEGTLSVPRSMFQRDTGMYMSERVFPGFSVDFFTYDYYLVPVSRSLITSEDSWSLLLSPGRIWSESGDQGMSRASFPFTLGSPAQRRITGGEVHNGVATFLFDENGVSNLRVQITQETAPDGNIYDMWGQFPLTYEPGAVENRDTHAAAFAAELEDQMPIRPWSELEAQVDPDTLATLTEGLEPDEISAAGIVLDGAIYLQHSRTRYGEYPYPRYMQHAAMSISKSIGAGIGMLWLAEKYGPEVFDLKIGDYIDITAEHDGWKDVTFGDLLNMASGVGEYAPKLRPFNIYANEKGANYIAWYLAETTAEKLRIIFLAGNYPWEPGDLFRYTSSQTFLLSAAMDAYLKSMEGPDAHLWERMMAEVFNPIGIHYLSMMHVPNGIGNPGIPLFSSGLRYTVDDVGKIVTLLQNGGRHNGVQLLHPAKLQEALLRTGEPSGLPTGNSFTYGDQGYHMSFWSIVHRTEDGRYFQVPFMAGAGGNIIMVLPNGVSTFVFTDAGYEGYSLNIPAIAEALRSYPEGDISLGWVLAGRGVWLIPEVQQKVRTANIILYAWLAAALFAAAYVGWHTTRRAKSGWKTRLFWIPFTFFTGPIGLAVYAYRRTKGKSHETKKDPHPAEPVPGPGSM